jgi:hypothetical protein
VSSSSRIDLDGADSGVVACKDREEAGEITQTTNLQPLPTTARPSSAPATAAGSGEPSHLIPFRREGRRRGLLRIDVSRLKKNEKEKGIFGMATHFGFPCQPACATMECTEAAAVRVFRWIMLNYLWDLISL